MDSHGLGDGRVAALGDPPEMAARATAQLAGSELLLLTDRGFAECVYVLESFYEVERERVALLMGSALALDCLQAVDPILLRRALEVYESDRMDFAEAYLVAQAEASGVGEILSFDRLIDRVRTVTRTRAGRPSERPCGVSRQSGDRGQGSSPPTSRSCGEHGSSEAAEALGMGPRASSEAAVIFS